MDNTFLFLISGFVSGLLGGLFGIGGGIVLVPFLTLYSDLSLVQASGISLFCIVGTSLSVSYRKLRSNQIDLNLVTKVETTALICGFLGSLLAHSLPVKIVQMCFAAMVSLLALLYFRKVFTSNDIDTEDVKHISQGAFQSIIGASGLFAGLLGIGGGAVIVPLLNKIAHIPIKVATATSAYIMGMTTAGGVLGHIGKPNFPFKAAVIALAGVKVGAWVGVKLSEKISDKVLKLVFLVLLCWVAFKMWMVSI